MSIGRGRQQRLQTAITTAINAVETVFQPQVEDSTDQFKYYRLYASLLELKQAVELDDRELAKSLGTEAFYRYVLFQGRVIEDESSALIVTDSFDEIFDLMTMLVAL